MTTSLTRSSAPLATFPRASITPSRVSLALFDITTTVGGLIAESHDSARLTDTAPIANHIVTPSRMQNEASSSFDDSER